MKANEIEDGKVLMIGDLVIGCIETDIVGEATYKIPCKVTDINHYGDVICEPLKSLPDELDWQDGDDYSWIEPIPLTPEILEKNGFVRSSVFVEWKYEEEGIYILWKPFPFLKIETENVQLNLSGCEYVHELQHALRLCGIEKTIEI